MKAVVAVNNPQSDKDTSIFGWYLLADSAVSNTGKPFYLPELRGVTTASLCVAVKICRLGKSVAKKFAGRYYSEICPAIHFRLPEYEKELISQGLPGDPSRSFDRSLFVGEPVEIKEDTTFELALNREILETFSLKEIYSPLEEFLVSFSKMNTLKMGDLIIPVLKGEITMSEGDLLEVYSGENKLFHIKVK